MDQNTFEVMIYNIEKFAREIFSSGMEAKFKVRLMETLDQIMKLGQSQNIIWQPRIQSSEFRPSKRIKLDQDRNMDLPNEIWSKVIKYLPSNDVYQSLNLVSKRFQCLALNSGVLRDVKIERFGYDKKDLDEKINFLKNSSVPMKFFYDRTIHKKEYLKAIFVAQNLKSLVIDLGGGRWFQLQKSVIKVLKQSKSELEHLELHGLSLTPEVLIEISKIKTLKTFRIHKADKVVITPEVVNAFAENENQLENIEFNDVNRDDGYDSDQEELSNELNNTLNNLLQQKSSTLKSLKYINWDSLGVTSTVRLTNLKLCQKVEEFCGELRAHDIESLVKLPRLKKLRLSKLENPKYLFDNLNLSHLKYLFVFGYSKWSKNKDTICQEVPKHYFPNLQRLFISESRVGLNEDFFSNMIENAPKLKSIDFSGAILPLSHQFLYHFCKNSNTFLCFDSKDFEKFLLGNDINVFGKYKRLEKSYKEWSSNNPEYSKLF